jgi:hypothetical protein
MPKFTLTCEHDGHSPSKNTLEFDAVFLDDVLEGFRQFLKGCTFEFDGNLELVDEYRYKEPDPDYEEDYVGTRVFDNMASTLMSMPETNIETVFIDEKCKVCGLQKSIMQRNICFDANCGLK